MKYGGIAIDPKHGMLLVQIVFFDSISCSKGDQFEASPNGIVDQGVGSRLNDFPQLAIVFKLLFGYRPNDVPTASNHRKDA